MKVFLFMATSVNGYIATTKDETPWSKEDWKEYSGFIKKKKNMIIGKRTYEIMLAGKEFEGLGNPDVVVVTGDDMEDYGNFTFVKSPEEALEVLKEMRFKEAVVAGGGHLNASFMEKKLIDEIFIDIEPQIFGNGIRLFEGNDFKLKLKLKKVRKIANRLIQVNYEVLK